MYPDMTEAESLEYINTFDPGKHEIDSFEYENALQDHIFEEWYKKKYEGYRATRGSRFS